MPTLCMLVPLYHAWLVLPFPCCLLPRWELTAYLPSFLWGLALPHPLPLS